MCPDTCPFITAGHLAMVWSLFLQNRHRLFLRHWHRSLLFILPLALCCSLGQSDSWLLWGCLVVVFWESCCCLAHLCLSWCSQYRLSWHCVVGGITTHILKGSNFANLNLKNTNKNHMSELTPEGRGFTFNSNKTKYSGHLCEDNANYLKTIRWKLTEIQPIHDHLGDKNQ